MNQCFGKKKLLVIDSDEIQLAMVESFLEDEYEVHKAKSEFDAIQYIIRAKCNFDLLMVDAVKPRMDRMEFFNLIKGISILQDIPVVFLTSSEKIEIEKKELAVPYISKPYNKAALRNTIKTLLEH